MSSHTSSHSRSTSPLSPPRPTPAAPPTVHWHRGVPDAIRALDTLTRVDYSDVVTATVDDLALAGRTPDEWIAVALKRMPRALLRVVPVIQRRVLGLRLHSGPSADHPLGWNVAARGDDWLMLEADSSLLTGHVILHRDGDRLSFATLIRYNQPLARAVWPPVSLVHRRVALVLVRGAVRG